MKKRPIALYLLVLLLALQGLGGLFGGLSLVLAPSGEIMQMPVSMLAGSPFTNFLIPGLILLVALGLLPLLLVWALLSQPRLDWFERLNIYKGIHWSWTYCLYLGIMLVIWIMVEIIFIPYDVLQTIFGVVGVAIIIVTLLPKNLSHFGWNRNIDIS